MREMAKWSIAILTVVAGIGAGAGPVAADHGGSPCENHHEDSSLENTVERIPAPGLWVTTIDDSADTVLDGIKRNHCAGVSAYGAGGPVGSGGVGGYAMDRADGKFAMR
jgi:hypothetical protein